MNLAKKRSSNWRSIPRVLRHLTAIFSLLWLLHPEVALFAQEELVAGPPRSLLSSRIEIQGSTVSFEVTRSMQQSGEPLRVRSFFLPSPPRFVLDIFDIETQLDSHQLVATDDRIRALRWGQHADYNRLVLDLRELPTSSLAELSNNSYGIRFHFSAPLTSGSEFDSGAIEISKREITILEPKQLVNDTVVTNTAKIKREFSVELLPRKVLEDDIARPLIQVVPRKFTLEPEKSQTLRLVSAMGDRPREVGYLLSIRATGGPTVGSASINVRMLPRERIQHLALSEVGHTVLLTNEGTIQAELRGALCSPDGTNCREIVPAIIPPNLSLLLQRSGEEQLRVTARYETAEQQIVYP